MSSEASRYPESSRLRVFGCLAASLDGCIGPAGEDEYVRISSNADIEHLKRLRNEADVLLFGAETFRTYPVRHQADDPSHFPLHLIMTRTADLDWQEALFNEPALSVGIVTALKRKAWPGSPPRGIQHYPLLGETQEAGLTQLLVSLADQGYSSLLVEGGGTIVQQFLAARLLDELYLTLTPTLIGHPEAPRLIAGAIPFKGGLHTRVLSAAPADGDVFLHLRIRYPD